jgi:hypothetical protein
MMGLSQPTPIFSMGLPNPSPVVVRPLLGMDLAGSELNLDPGAFLDLQNLVVRPKGLYRIPGYDEFLGGNVWSPSDVPCLLDSGWGTNGVQYPFLFTQNYIFYCDWNAGYTRVAWTYTTGTVSTSGTAVTGSGTLWLTLGINSGDLMTIGATTYVISAVVSDTSITLQTSAGSQSNVAYSISRLLGGGVNYNVDTCEVQDITIGQYLAVATPGNQIAKVTPSTFAVANLTPTAAKQPATGGIKAQAIAFFVGRIFAGNLTDGSNGSQRTMIRWSKSTDTADFSDTTAYLSLLSQGSPFTGAIQRMVPLGTLLVVYLDDAIFIGSPSNTANLPLSFQQLPSGRVGIAGPRAIASFVLPSDGQKTGATGHFFVGTDNIYFLSSNLSLQAIGSKIARDSILSCKYPNRIQTSIDYFRRRVRFGFPVNGPQIEKIFEFDWETREWSYEPRTTWLIGDAMLSSSWSPVGMRTVTGDDMATMTGILMCLSEGVAGTFNRSHFVENNGALWISASNENALNPDDTAVALVIETPDYDEGAPGLVKFWRMLRLKITWDGTLAPASNIDFTIEISLDRGRTYRDIGNLTIVEGNDEGYINFRATGPHIRFRIKSSSPVTPYYITEMTRLASIRGVQSSMRQQNAVH